MTESLVDALVVGSAVLGGLLVGGLHFIIPPTHEAAAPSPRRQGLVRGTATVLVLVGLLQGALAVVRLLSPDSSGARMVPVVLGLALAMAALVLASVAWRNTTKDDAASTRARFDEASTMASVAARGATTLADRDGSTPDLRAMGSSRLASLLLEGSSDAIGAPLPTDMAEFDARMMHANRMQSIGRLAGGIAHDFNNLLTSILTSAEMAQEALPAEHGVTPDLEEIRRAGTRASELTRQLLAFARRDVRRPQVLDANVLVGNLATMLRRLLGETITLRISLGHDVPLLYADGAQLEQVIVNLAVNARDAMPDGGELHVQTRRGYPSGRSARDGSSEGVVVEVEDDGVGLSLEVRDRLFEPFFTTKTPGRGTGLGLATCQAIVVAHGGEIEVAGRPTRGSVFRVWLPPTDQHVDGRLSTDADAARASLDAAQQTILVVEDDADVRMSTSRALRRAGYTVLEAADGEDAMSQIETRATPVDLVVSDVVMPRLGGAEFARRLHTRYPGLPVLFVSGYPGDSPDVKALEAQGMHLLEKPYTPSILLFEVRLRLDAARSA